MTYGLVLEGGGAKGSYQMGSYRAVLERGLEFSAVVGSSIGALNGAFIVQEDIDTMIDIWKSGEFELDEKFTHYLSSLRSRTIPDPRNLAKTFQCLGQMDIGPLREIIEEYIDEESIRNSGLDYGLTVYSLSERKTRLLYKEEIPKGKLKDYILASCCYPCFAPIKIDGKLYIDGGIGNNIPYEMVVKKGLTPLILRTNPMRAEDNFPEESLIIAPKFPVAKTMTFDPIKAKGLIKKGYLHGLRIIDKMDGYDYSFYPFTEAEAFRLIYELFLLHPDDFRYMTTHPSKSRERKILEGLIPDLAKELRLDETYSYKEFLIAFLENKAKKEKINESETYSIEEFISLLRERSRKSSLGNGKGYLERCQHLIFRPSHN